MSLLRARRGAGSARGGTGRTARSQWKIGHVLRTPAATREATDPRVEREPETGCRRTTQVLRPRSRSRLAAIPVATFVLALAATYAYFELRGGEERAGAAERHGPPEAGTGKLPAATGKDRIGVAVPGKGEGEGYL